MTVGATRSHPARYRLWIPASQHLALERGADFGACRISGMILQFVGILTQIEQLGLHTVLVVELPLVAAHHTVVVTLVKTILGKSHIYPLGSSAA